VLAQQLAEVETRAQSLEMGEKSLAVQFTDV